MEGRGRGTRMQGEDREADSRIKQAGRTVLPRCRAGLRRDEQLVQSADPLPENQPNRGLDYFRNPISI